MSKHHIVIDVDEAARIVKITHQEDDLPPQETFFESCAVLAGDARQSELFIKMYGASADVAWAYGQGYRIAHTEKGGCALRNFYKQCAAHVCNIVDPAAFRNEIGAAEILNRWEDPDQTRWFGQDSEDVLRDKQKSEAKRKKFVGAEGIVTDDTKKDDIKWN